MTTIENKIGFIYKIVCNNPEITDCYVGSCQSFRTRKSKHKHTCNNENNKNYNLNVYQFIRNNGGWSNWSMLAIEQIEYTIKHELLMRERYHLERLRATLNKQIPSRTKQEYCEYNKTQINEQQKQYREANKEQINEQKKQWYEANKTQISEQQKQYYEANKTQISERNKQLITCACGKSSTKINIPRHNKSIYHQNYIANLPKVVPSEVAGAIVSIL